MVEQVALVSSKNDFLPALKPAGKDREKRLSAWMSVEFRPGVPDTRLREPLRWWLWGSSAFAEERKRN